MSVRWANHSDIGSSDVFEALHSGLTVKLISTHRADLMTCRLTDSLSDVMERNMASYDFLPVIGPGSDGRERIIGLFHAARFFGVSSVEGNVRQQFNPLSEEYLVGADGSILNFIKDAGEKPCRLVVSGTEIVGLVTLSDLQKLPVRAALFALITGFEITMFNAIKRECLNDQDWMRFLSDGRQKKISEEIARSRKGDSFVDALLFTQFCDKAEILVKCLPLARSKTKLHDQLNAIQKLRDKIAHANEYAASPEHARKVSALVRGLLVLKGEIEAIKTIEPHSVSMDASMKA